MQIDLIGMSQMVGYPTQFPSVSMMDWTENKPNARFWVLKLIKDSFHSGDQLVDTTVDSGDVAAQAFRNACAGTSCCWPTSAIALSTSHCPTQTRRRR